MRVSDVNYFAPFWLAGAILLGIFGKVDWWVVILIIASHVKIR